MEGMPGLQPPAVIRPQSAWLLGAVEQRSQPVDLLVFLSGGGAPLAGLHDLGLQVKVYTSPFTAPAPGKQILSLQS